MHVCWMSFRKASEKILSAGEKNEATPSGFAFGVTPSCLSCGHYFGLPGLPPVDVAPAAAGRLLSGMARILSRAFVASGPLGAS